MASVNKWILIGNVGRDPELRSTARTTTLSRTCRLRRASSGRTSRNERLKQVEWHRVSFFGKARRDRRRVRQRAAGLRRGRLQTRKWQDKDGQDRYTTEIVADRMQMLGAGPATGTIRRRQRRRTRSRSGRRAVRFAEDSIPF